MVVSAHQVALKLSLVLFPPLRGSHLEEREIANFVGVIMTELWGKVHQRVENADLFNDCREGGDWD